MKKVLLVLVALFLSFAFVACDKETTTAQETTTAESTTAVTGPYVDQTLVVYFVPSRPADEILQYTEPLADLLEAELARLGYPVGGVEILVSSTYEAAGEALLAGTGDIGFLPGGTYVAYKDLDNSPLQVILAATRAGLSKDSSDAADWNDGEATEGDSDYQVEYYKGLIIAGTSTEARALSAKVNAGTTLVWDDVKDLDWCVRSATSSSGYIYPAIWLQDNFGKTFDDVEGTVTITGGYGDTMASLATGTCDVGTIYADARRDYADEWTAEYGRTESIWAETDVVGVTANIMNDTITVSTVNLDRYLIAAITLAFINIAQTPEGLAVMEVYSHEGYITVTDADYDGARAAAALVS